LLTLGPDFSTFTVTAGNARRDNPTSSSTPPLTLNIFFIGDIVGTPGLDLAATLIPNYVKKYSVDLLIVNGENTTEGKGIAEEHAKKLFDLGAHVITTGNHVWDRWTAGRSSEATGAYSAAELPERERRGTATTWPNSGGREGGDTQSSGEVFMQPIDDPFRTADWAVAKIHEETPVVFVDFHADATAEKMAMGWHLDGKVTAVIGRTPTRRRPTGGYSRAGRRSRRMSA
jgi:calcineurin-like phosphoesterase